MPFSPTQIQVLPLPERGDLKRRAHKLPIAHNAVRSQVHNRRQRVGSLEDVRKLYHDSEDLKTTLNAVTYWSITQIKKHLENVFFAKEAELISKELYDDWNTRGFKAYLTRKAVELPSIEDANSNAQWGAQQVIGKYRLSTLFRDNQQSEHVGADKNNLSSDR